jgi:deazaflavin-dependent oxidoreductase (nitroreductase family)
MTSRPGPILKRALALPAALYGIGAGWLLGHRFLLLVHRGRRTGRVYRTVLEVVHWQREPSEAVVMSGFGRDSQWYRNVLAGGAVEIRIGRRRYHPTVRPLPEDEAMAVLAAYERRNRVVVPVIRAVLSRLAGIRYDGSASSRRSVVQALPLVAFRSDDQRGVSAHVPLAGSHQP